MTPKYFEKIRAAQAAARDASPRGDFDFSALKNGGLGARLAQSRLVHAFLRSFWPVGRIGRFAWAVRYADVADLRKRNAEFEAPYGEEMRELTGGADFALGMPDSPAYWRQVGFMRQVMRRDDVARLIAPNAQRLSKALLIYSGGSIDAVEDYLLRVAVETCADYFGLDLDDPIAFAQWLMSISALLFADYLGDADVRRLALNGAARVRKVMDEGIRKAHETARRRSAPPKTGAPDYDAWRSAIDRHEATLVGRLVDLQLADPANGPGDDEIRAMLIGMSVGYVPTGAGAGGNILEVLLRRPKWLAEAVAAARRDDNRRLKSILREAMRFSPPINPGVPRYVARDAKLGRARLPKGTMIVAASMAAMFDPRAVPSPNRFNPDRTLDGDLQFGGDFLHYCIGEPIADALLLEAFKPLLCQQGLRRREGARGRLEKTGPFPRHLHLAFSPSAGHRTQSMVTACIPVSEPVPLEALNREIDRLGNPSRPDVKEALDGAGLIHFAHISAVETGNADQPVVLLVELSADGPEDAAIGGFAEAGKTWLVPLFTLACGVKTSAQIARLISKHSLRLVAGRSLASGKTASGLNYFGTPELSVAQIDGDARLADAARNHLDEYLRQRGARGATATSALKWVRERIRQTPLRAGLARPRNKTLAVSRRGDKGAGAAFGALLADWRFSGKIVLGALLFLAGYYVLAHGIDTWEEARRVTNVALRTAGSLVVGGAAAVALALMWRILAKAPEKGKPPLAAWLSSHILGVAFAAIVFALAHFVLLQTAIGEPAWDGASLAGRLALVAGTLINGLATAVVGLLLLAVIATAFFGLLVVLLRRSEMTAPIEDFDPPFDQVRALLNRENPPGYAQNHIIAVTPLKTNPRWLRRLTLGLAFWVIEKMVQYQFRPGFVLDIGTIHFARWFRLPGTDKLIFLSNYDGSWESYLEDFITKAHGGQTSVWSNGVGFPATRFLFLDGAADGAKFKRWVRRQQVETRFWYSRFPRMTTSQIQANAMICEGLAKACTDSDAQAWLDLFGSRPRPNTTLEYEEIQTIAFSGMSRLKSSELIPLRFTDKDDRWRQWLTGLAGGDPGATLEEALRSDTVSFGETVGQDCAATVAFSFAGLQRMGLGALPYGRGGNPAGTTLDSFPTAFASGMASPERRRLLGDHGASDAAGWSWGKDRGEPHAVLLLYAKDQETLRRYSVETRQRLQSLYGLEALPAIAMQDLPPNVADIREPFGFHDGVSQPVMRGTQRFHDDTSPIHAVEPGEFILGYPDNRGDIPPSPVVASEFDCGILPDLVGNLPARFPDFRGERAAAPRDLGRNGSFLVIRQLEQDVAGFEAQAEKAALRLQPAFPSERIDRDWVAARMVGRWKDGSSLARHPYAPGGKVDNDFLYGVEDPQGTRCPYSAHIRRAFPRDSLSPENPKQLSISNRHRLLRRGRSYVETSGERQARGLLFMCLNADIERQFEFVQQTWLSSSDFHGQAGEHDPVAGGEAGAGPRGCFTIQTPTGPVKIPDIQSFVTVRNGGYFFLPSRSALRFFAALRG